jgi:hypothetical protein
MLKRLKTALIDSFVGAIAIGWLFATGIREFVDMINSPYFYWKLIYPQFSPPVRPLQLALSNLIASAFLLLIAYGLLRWLYYPAREIQSQELYQEPEQDA